VGGVYGLSFWLSCHIILDVGLPLRTIWRWRATGFYKSRNITSLLSMFTILAVARIPDVGISLEAWHYPSNSTQNWCCSVLERRSSVPTPNAPRAPPIVIRSTTAPSSVLPVDQPHCCFHEPNLLLCSRDAPLAAESQLHIQEHAVSQQLVQWRLS
jgi:hypothetical protein